MGLYGSGNLADGTALLRKKGLLTGSYTLKNIFEDQNGGSVSHTIRATQKGAPSETMQTQNSPANR